MNEPMIEIDDILPPEPLPDLMRVDRKAVEMWSDWELKHRIGDRVGHSVVRGFSESGCVTLWLPDPKTQSSLQFQDGKPVNRIGESVMTTPAMVQLRIDTLLALRSPEGRLRFDVQLAVYAAKIIGLCYAASDDDLTQLLAGHRWHESVVRHLLGGDQQVDRLVRQNASEALRPKTVYVPIAMPAEPKKRSRFWHRWLSH